MNSRIEKLRIIYPHNQRFMLRRAHDILVMKTCHALAVRGHEVFLLMGRTCPDTGELLKYYGLESHPNLHCIQLPILRKKGRLGLSWHAVFNLFCLKAIRQLVGKGTGDLVYMTELKLADFLLRRKSRIGLPFIYEVHGLMAPGYSEPDKREKRVFQNCELLLTTTRSLKKVMEEIYSPPIPILQAPLATYFPDGAVPFSPPEAGKPWRVGYIGQLYPLQGVDTAIRAMPLLPDTVVLDVVGGKEEHIRELRHLSQSLRIGDRVHFHGFVAPDEVAAGSAGMHMFVAPSLNRGKMPFVAHTKIYEYMALGRPLIASDLPSIREEVQDGVNGLLFEAGNYHALATAVMTVVSDPKAASAMAAEARKHSDSFSWEHRARILESCFFGELHAAEGL